MGCDIHMHVEVQNAEGVWEHRWPELVVIRSEEVECGHDLSACPDSVLQVNEYSEASPYWDRKWKSILHVGRNYDLFAILADVRNGYGFAGCDTGNGYVPMADPKGVPDDASPEYKWMVARWAGDGHSHSHFTVEEIEAYDWDRATIGRGWVSAREYPTYKKEGVPTYASGFVEGPSVRHISNEEMELLLADPPKDSKLQYYTQVEWRDEYKEQASNFLTKTLPELKKMGDPDKVRIVFFFDN